MWYRSEGLQINQVKAMLGEEEEMTKGKRLGSGRVKKSLLVWPMLTRSNYVEWAMLMQINLKALEI
jgi:hypothetical protein